MTDDWRRWDTRYDSPDYLFGTEPAQFLVDHASHFQAGDRALVVADGEGRNSVYLAQQGLSVKAMDGSAVAVDKARRLAHQRGVEVTFDIADIMTWDWTAEPFDLVVAIFIQFADPDQRAGVFDGMIAALKPGGLLMLHGYTPEQVDLGTGGPPHRENMYTRQMLASHFSGLEILRLETYEAIIEEGEGHSGRSALIDLIARKPA